MASEFPSNDPRNIWQRQPTESFHMSLDLIRYKAQEREQRARLEATISIAMAAVLCVVFASVCVRIHETVPRIGWGMLSLWCIYFAWHAYHWIWPRSPASDATVSTSLEFYRSELERRRDYARHVFRRSGLIFCFLGLGLAVVPPLMNSPDMIRQLPNAAPFFVLLVVWAVAFTYQRRRNQQKLQQEIEELRAFERQNPRS